MRAHLLIVNQREEVVLDEDVNDVELGKHWLKWRSWEKGAKSQAEEHEIYLADLAEVRLTPCQDRLKPVDCPSPLGRACRDLNCPVHFSER